MHSLVLLTFVGPRPDGMGIDHLNEDKLDNHLENLEYVTNQENLRRFWSRHRFDHKGGRPRTL